MLIGICMLYAYIYIYSIQMYNIAYICMHICMYQMMIAMMFHSPGRGLGAGLARCRSTAVATFRGARPLHLHLEPFGPKTNQEPPEKAMRMDKIV